MSYIYFTFRVCIYIFQYLCIFHECTNIRELNFHDVTHGGKIWGEKMDEDENTQGSERDSCLFYLDISSEFMRSIFN